MIRNSYWNEPSWSCPSMITEPQKEIHTARKEAYRQTARMQATAANGTNAIGASANGTGDFFNNRYQLNIRDKIKENVIKIVKVDSETGKQIPLKGTKIFIRYKGNPDLTDEENEKAFGPGGTVSKDILNRFLPNAESINSKSTNYTFELDENGETIIPYELPYGKYEVYEWLLPDGYFVGAVRHRRTRKEP